MDLQARGAWALARCFADDFIAASDDAEGEELLSFYTGYRATVRAKVAALAAAEAELGAAAQAKARAKAEARARLALVELSAPAARPCMILVAGLPGTGKSVLARGLRETGGFAWIRSDELRKRLAGLDPLASGRSEVDGGIYTKEWSDRTYAACLQRAGDVCMAGGRALVDATFIDGRRRADFVEAAVGWGVPVHLLITDAPPELVRERLAARTGDPSDADWNVYQAARERWSPVDPTLCRFNKIDAAGTPTEMLSDATRALQKVGLL
jgi:predicted kinase